MALLVSFYTVPPSFLDASRCCVRNTPSMHNLWGTKKVSFLLSNPEEPWTNLTSVFVSLLLGLCDYLFQH